MTNMAAEQWLSQKLSETPAPTLYNTTDNDPDLRASSGSPSSAHPDIPLEKPDISMLCGLCGIHVDLCALADHRHYHEALDIMNYKGAARPESTTKLMQRRHAILFDINALLTGEDPPIDSNIIHRINDAYEFLKADLEETYEAFRKVRDTPYTDVEGVGVNSQVGCVLAVGKCSDPNSRWKSAMEDANTFQDCLGGDPNKAFIGLYDGHHGHYAAERTAEEFHHALLYEMVKFDTAVKWTEAIANKAHCVCDYGDFAWPADEEEEDHGIEQDGGICAMHQVIRTFEDRLERLKKERAQEATEMDIETSRDTFIDNGSKGEHTVDRTRKSSRKRKYGNAYSEMVEYAMSQAYKYMDLLLSWGKEEHSRIRWSGCSAFTAMIEGAKENAMEDDEMRKSIDRQEEDNQQENVQGNLKELGRLHLAHAGNVKCVLVRGNQTYRLTREHTPRNQRERMRVEKLGGSISNSDRDVRVNGIVSATRGLGNHGDALLKTCVPSTPYTTVVPIDEHAQLLLIASQGVWEVFTQEEAAHVLLEMLPCNQLPAPSRLAASVQYLIAAKSRCHTADTSHVPASELLDRLRTFSAMTAASVPLPDHLQERSPSSDVTKQRHVTSAVNDLQTELGSLGGFSDEESGNEADIDTCIDEYTIPGVSRMSIAPPVSKDEIQQEFAKVLAERLVKATILAGSKDNVTAMVVLLPGCGL